MLLAALRLGRFSLRNRPRSVPLAPRQGDLRLVDIATVKNTLGPVHGDVDNCPVAVELNEPAAVECPQEARAAGIVEGPLGRTTEQTHSAQNVDLAGKRFELLREIVPGLRRLAVLFNGNDPTAMTEIDIVRTAATPLGIEVSPSAILGAEDIAPAIARIAKRHKALAVIYKQAPAVPRDVAGWITIVERSDSLDPHGCNWKARFCVKPMRV